MTIYKPIDAVAPREVGRALGGAISVLWMLEFFLSFSVESHFSFRYLITGLILFPLMIFNTYYFDYRKINYQNFVLSYKPILMYQVLVFLVVPALIIYVGVFVSF